MYDRFKVLEVVDVLGHHLPQLISSDDRLLILEMTVVKPPFLLDFAGADLDRKVEFPPKVLVE